MTKISMNRIIKENNSIFIPKKKINNFYMKIEIEIIRINEE
jgi:hypothetical protein